VTGLFTSTPLTLMGGVPAILFLGGTSSEGVVCRIGWFLSMPMGHSGCSAPGDSRPSFPRPLSACVVLETHDPGPCVFTRTSPCPGIQAGTIRLGSHGCGLRLEVAVHCLAARVGPGAHTLQSYDLYV